MITEVVEAENKGRLKIAAAASKGYIVGIQVCRQLRVINTGKTCYKCGKIIILMSCAMS